MVKCVWLNPSGATSTVVTHFLLRSQAILCAGGLDTTELFVLAAVSPVYEVACEHLPNADVDTRCHGRRALCYVCCVYSRWSCFFLVFTSLMLLEKRLDARFEGRPDYDAYKARTSVLVPWFLKE